MPRNIVHVPLDMQDIAKKYPDGMPQLDPVNDMGIQDATVLSAIQQMDQLEQQLAKNPGELPEH
jgi:ATP-dependent RNA helicase DOB1